MRIDRYGRANRRVGYRDVCRFMLLFGLGTFLAAGVARADYGSARIWFHSQSVGERNRLQTELYWSGDYVGRIDATFGPLTYAALQSLQLRAGGQTTGVLDRQQLTYLHADAGRVQTFLSRIRYQRPRYVTQTRTIPRGQYSYRPEAILILP